MVPDIIRVLVVDDEDVFREGTCERLIRRGFEALPAANGEEALALAAQNLFDVALVDIRMPGFDGIEVLARLKEIHQSLEVIILTGAASVPTAIEAMKLGAYDYLNKSCKFEELQALIVKAYEKKKLRQHNMALEREVRRLTFTGELVGASEKALEIRRFIEQAAAADCPVLIEGESGVGKELVAREIHSRSPRSRAPFVVLNCGAFPETLLADELFGHERGAFTTALDTRQGLVEIANGGTLLIDEIGEMNVGNQVALLRVVETSRFRRLGASKELQVNVRIIAATNRNLQNEVARDRFREDLFYRLNVLRFVVPPLRERRDDILLLADHFLNSLNCAKGASKRLTPETKDWLINYSWPGNVRELANLVERGFYTSPHDEIGPRDLVGSGEVVPASVSWRTPQSAPTDPRTLSDIERAHILNVLTAEKGNKKKAARVLGISRTRLYNLLKKYHIPYSTGS
ncbi:MAG: sigma-54 dependent transcriptional regulator [Candidatus Abyssubacteria bacterium]